MRAVLKLTLVVALAAIAGALSSPAHAECDPGEFYNECTTAVIQAQIACNNYCQFFGYDNGWPVGGVCLWSATDECYFEYEFDYCECVGLF